MLDYYVYKVKNILLTRFAAPLASVRSGPGFIGGAIGEFRFRKRVLFYFADARLVHLGDQLFHQPLLNLWRRGFDLSVATGSAMAPYFTSQGIKVIEPCDYGQVNGAVIISKNDLAYAAARLFPNGNYFVGVNYHLIEDDGPISVALARAVYDALGPLGIELPPLPETSSPIYLPYVPCDAMERLAGADWAVQLEADRGSRYLAYNDFVSSNHLSASRRQGVIEGIAVRKRAEGCKIIYVGAPDELLRRPNPPSFIDLDLRGKFGALGLYKLLSLANVDGMISFDTFAMHVASALRKDLYVVRKSASYPAGYRRKYVPMYPGADEIVKAYV